MSSGFLCFDSLFGVFKSASHCLKLRSRQGWSPGGYSQIDVMF